MFVMINENIAAVSSTVELFYSICAGVRSYFSVLRFLMFWWEWQGTVQADCGCVPFHATVESLQNAPRNGTNAA
jgi:hypothetical protein